MHYQRSVFISDDITFPFCTDCLVVVMLLSVKLRPLGGAGPLVPD